MPPEWPKPWDEIRPPLDDTPFTQLGAWVDMGPMRFYEETAYINADGGRETDENRDLWMPLEAYLRGGYADA